MKSLGVPSFDRTWGKATDICLIAEGCYPHVTGGVSSWIDWLMRNLPDYSFSVVSLVSGDESRTSRYPFPPNLLHFVELDLKGPGPSQRFGRRLKVSSAQVDDFTQALWRLVQKGGIDTLADVISAMDKFPRRPTYQDLTQSEFAWDVVCGMYRRIMPEASFIDFFWAWQSLVGGLFATLTFNLPQARIYHTISTGYAGILAARAAIDTNCRTLITEHGIYTNERRIEILTADWIVDTIDNGLATDNRLMDIRDLWIKAFESYARTCYDACDTITTLYGDNQKLQLELGADRDRLKIIPNGIDVDRFGAVRPEHGNPPTMALVGRVVPIKDVKTYISAARIVRESVPGLRALVLGPVDEDPQYAEECLQMIADLDLQETVFLAGRVNVLEWLPRIHVMVLSSLSEAQPLTILEAGAAGIPCVTTNVGSCSEILHGAEDEFPRFGAGGIVTDVVSPDQIAEGVVALLRDDHLRREMGNSLRRRVRHLYSSERSRDAYARLYGDPKPHQEVVRWQA